MKAKSLGKYFLILLVSILSATYSKADKPASINNNGKISHAQAISDLDTFISTLRNIHPNLFYACSEASFNEEYKKIKEQIPDRPISKTELYKLIQPLTTLLCDGHTQLYFPEDELIKDNPLVFPLSVDIDTNDSCIYVANDYDSSGMKIKKSSKIISINGIDYKTLIREMLNYCGGERPFFRLSKISRDFLHFLYMLSPCDTFIVKCSYNNEMTENLIDAVPYLQCGFLTQNKNIASEPYSFKAVDNQTMLMTFNSFYNPDQFNVFCDSMFQRINSMEMENLIIDMRVNGGGNSNIGDELFQYISPVPFQQFEKTICKYSNLQKKLALESFGADYSSQPNGTYEFVFDSLIALRPNSLRFKGNTYLLISHTTFSSAGSFSWAFKKFNMGTIIGEESGGMSVCFGNIVIYKLPNSDISSTISYARMYEYDADDKNIHGTIPDITIPQKDALRYTLQYISEKY